MNEKNDKLKLTSDKFELENHLLELKKQIAPFRFLFSNFKHEGSCREDSYDLNCFGMILHEHVQKIDFIIENM